MHPLVSKHLFYRIAFLLRGEKVAQCMKEVDDFYSQPARARRTIQLHKLTALLDFAYRNNTYYRALFDERGIRPSDVSTLDDLRNLPCLTKSTLQAAGDRMLSRHAPATFRRTTSGSTGIPLVLRKDVVASSYMAAQMLHAYSWHDLHAGDRFARIWGVPFGFRRKLVTSIKDWALNRRRLSSFDISPRSCGTYYQTLLKFKPKYMHGLPSTISAFAIMLKELNLDPARIGFKAVVTSGEVLFQTDRALITGAFGCPAVDEYGTTETGLIAFESPDGRLVESTHNHIIEVIDPDTGIPVRPGEAGQVCVTELHSFGVPLIRYLVGDLAIQTVDGASPDQSTTIKQIMGRVSDLIVCPDGKKVAAAVLDYSFGPGVRQFKAFQRSLSHLEILIVKGDGFSGETLARVEQKLRSKLGNDMTIDFSFVDAIPVSSSGKMTVLESYLSNSGEKRPGAAWTRNTDLSQ